MGSPRSSAWKLPRISATLTVFNRADVTVNCLRSLLSQEQLNVRFELEVFVVDDGSTDDTASILRAAFGDRVHVIRSHGGLYWARGMAEAQRSAFASNPDYNLWLNDDVLLDDNAVIRLVDLLNAEAGADIAVGATHADDGTTSYSGAKRVGRSPGALRRLDPNGSTQPIDAFNGNIVLVSRRAYQILGTIDEKFAHAYGDNDYGLRARNAGLQIILGPTYLGRCSRNSIEGTWGDPTLPARVRVRHMLGPKGMPVRSQFRYYYRHGGLVGLAFCVATYGRFFGTMLLEGVFNRGQGGRPK